VRLRPTAAGETVSVALERSGVRPSDDQAFWVAIRNSTSALSFERYRAFVDNIMCGRGGLDVSSKGQLNSLDRRRALPYPDVDASRLLKVATEFLMMSRCGVRIDRYPLGAPFQGWTSRTSCPAPTAAASRPTRAPSSSGSRSCGPTTSKRSRTAPTWTACRT
jgi:hypothetical protein